MVGADVYKLSPVMTIYQESARIIFSADDMTPLHAARIGNYQLDRTCLGQPLMSLGYW
jgi:hypothetical protein